MTDWLGKTLGKVRIEKLIARGGMAEVYYGMHTTLERPVAVKVMLSFLEDDPDLKTRFGREARVLASLRHSNIVQIFDFDVAEGQPYFVMEYLDGPTLADHLRDVHTSGKRLSLPQIGRIMVMLASALDYAHAQGVIHRDIKPGNMILHAKSAPVIPGTELTEGVEIILTDFGLLRLTDSTSHSVSGTIAGTPAYISPEQARGDKVDHRTDLYSLGVVLYEMLAGRVPFEAESSMGILMKHISETPTPIPGLPVALQNVLDRALAKKPADRYNTGRELTRAFLEATSLSESEVAPGHRLTPTPGSTSAVTLPPDKDATVLSKPKIANRQSRFQPWLLAIPVALVALIIVSTLILVNRISTTASPQPSTPAVPTLEPTRNPTSSAPTPEPAPATEASHGHAEEISTPMTGGSTSGDLKKFGLLRFYDLSGILDEVILTSDGLPPAPAGSQYEAWLVGGEARRSLGVLSPDASGKAELTFLDEKSRNLLTQYEGLEITLEDNPDQSPNPSGKVVYSSGIPPKALSHIRHVLVAFGGAPNDTGLMVGLIADVSLLETNAAALVAAHDKKNAAGVRKNAEAIFNLLVGSQGKGYGDLDKDGKVTDPGDGYGLFLNGDNAGYLEGTLQHAQLAMQMPDASANIQLHGGHVGIVVKNIEEWATELFPLLTQVLDDPLGPNSAQQVREIAALIDRIQQGRDLNGNEKIEPVPGEGGVETALQHAGYMTDMPILEGAEQLPPPAVK